MEAGFDSVRAEIKRLREEFKHEIVQMKHGIRSLKQSIAFMQDEVDTERKGGEKYERNEAQSGRGEQENCGSRIRRSAECCSRKNIKLDSGWN